jgi:hypothetical protein
MDIGGWLRSLGLMRSRIRCALLTNRINIFVSLPMKSLDALTLQKQLDAIGKTTDRASNPEKEAG